MPETDIISGLLRVLIVDDDDAVGNALVSALERAGMQTAWAHTGAEGLALRNSFLPDVALLDLHLPDVDGLALVRRFVGDATCGVIVVSGMGDEADRIVGLELGADDYISKPPSLRELLARVRAVYRRIRARRLQRSDRFVKLIFAIGDIEVNTETHTVHFPNGDKVELTSAELAALKLLMTENGKPVTRGRLCEVALHRSWRAEDRSVDQLIFNLRHKLGYDQIPIHSVRGQGYILTLPSNLPSIMK